MIRTIIIPDKSNVSLSFSIPESYIGKEIEVIAFSREEGFAQIEQITKITTFNALSIDTKSFKFSRDESNER